MLDSTLDVPPPGTPGWWLTVTPAAAEAGGSFRYSRSSPRVYVPGQPAGNPQRARSEAARRARARVRRYCTANRLTRLGTLTYRGEGCFDQVALRADVAPFFRSLRDNLGVDRLPYLWVPEWHKSHGLHVHFAVGQYIARRLIEQAWPHGFVHIKLIGDVPIGAGRLGESRKVAGYLSKYVTKAFDDERIPRLHRFDVAQGFQPEKVRVYGVTAEDAVESAAVLMPGLAADRVWSSANQIEWQGPPAVWVSWA